MDDRVLYAFQRNDDVMPEPVVPVDTKADARRATGRLLTLIGDVTDAERVIAGCSTAKARKRGLPPPTVDELLAAAA